MAPRRSPPKASAPASPRSKFAAIRTGGCPLAPRPLYPEDMRRLLLGLVLLALAWLGAWSLLREPARPRQAAARPAVSVEPAASSASAGARGDDEPRSERARRLREGAARREGMRQQIEAALAASQVEAASRPAAPGAADAPPAPSPRPAPAEDTGSGSIVDRTGNHAYLARVLHNDLIPLVDECLELAREDRPDLAGLLELDVEILGDEDIGGVVDALELGQRNEIVEPALIECVRESLLATTLPPPSQGGRDAISLSLRFDPPGSDHAP